MEESVSLLFCLLATSLLGILVGVWWQRLVVERRGDALALNWQSRVGQLESELDRCEAERRVHAGELSSKERELAELRDELESTRVHSMSVVSDPSADRGLEAAGQNDVRTRPRDRDERHRELEALVGKLQVDLERQREQAATVSRRLEEEEDNSASLLNELRSLRGRWRDRRGDDARGATESDQVLDARLGVEPAAQGERASERESREEMETLRKTITALEGSLDEATEEIKRLRKQAEGVLDEGESAEIESLRRAMASKDETLVALNAQVARLESERANTSAQDSSQEVASIHAEATAQLEGEVDTLQRAMASKDETLVALNAQVARLESELASASAQDSAQEVASVHAEATAQLEGEVDTLQRAMASKDETLVALNAQVVRLESELASASAQDSVQEVASIDTEATAQLEGEVETLQRAMASKDETLVALNAQVSRLESELASASAQDSSQEVASLHAEATAQLEGEVDTLQRAMASKDETLVALNAQVVRLESELASASAQDSVQEVASIDTEATAQLEGEVETLQRAMASKDETLVALNAQVSRLESELASASVQDSVQEVASIDTEATAQLEGEVETLQRAMASKDETLVALNAQVSRLESELASASAQDSVQEVASIDAEVETLQRAMASKDETLVSLNAQVSRLESELASASAQDSAQEVASLHAEATAQLEGEVETLQRAMASKDETLVSLNAQVVRLESELASASAQDSAQEVASIHAEATAQLEGEVETLQRAMASKDETLVSLNAQVVRLESELASASAQDSAQEVASVHAEATAQLEGEVETLQRAMASKDETLVALNAQVVRLESELASASAQDSVQEVASVHAEATAQLEGEMESLRRSLASKDETLLALTAQVGRLESELTQASSSQQTEEASIQTEIQELRSEVERLRWQSSRREGEEGDLKSRDTELDDLRVTARSLEQSLAAASEEIVQLRETSGPRQDDTEELQEAVATLRRSLEASNEALRQERETHSNELSRLTRSTEEANAVEQRMSLEVEELRTTVASLEEALSASRVEHELADQGLDSDESLRLQQRIGELEQELSGSRLELERRDQLIANLGQGVAAAGSSRESERDEIRSSASSTGGPTDSLQEVIRLRGRVEGLETQLASIEEESSNSSQSETQIVALRSSVSSLEAALGAASEAFDRLSQRTTDADETKRLRSQSRQLERELELSRKRAERLERRLQEAAAEMRAAGMSRTTRKVAKKKTRTYRLPNAVRRAPRERDDLKLIRGVGPKLERFLNENGIYTFRQIAKWTRQEVSEINERLEHFRGRIVRDRWVTGARTQHRRKYGEAP